MTVYRRQRDRNPLWMGLAILAAIFVIGAVAWLLRSRATTTIPADPLAGARAKAQEAARGLDVFAIEYPQGNQGSERRGALDALARAQSTFASAQNELATVAPDRVAQIAGQFADLERKAEAGVSPDEVIPLAEALQKELLVLAGGDKVTR